ncbi:MAG: aminoacyl-tRNA hydrolase [Gammaproteobacteria bacterium]
MEIKLIAGLANPGSEYAQTRHNAGAWFIHALAEQMDIPLRLVKKFHGLSGDLKLDQQSCHLLIPTTFMNHSGQAIKAMSVFYKIEPAAILIAHDDIDLSVGVVKLKTDGGHGGHNGLRDIIQHLGNNKFHRLRIGVGHPGHRDRVHDYVLNRPSRSDQQKILANIDDAVDVMPLVINGDIQKAMLQLHTEKGD